MTRTRRLTALFTSLSKIGKTLRKKLDKFKGDCHWYIPLQTAFNISNKVAESDTRHGGFSVHVDQLQNLNLNLVRR